MRAIRLTALSMLMIFVTQPAFVLGQRDLVGRAALAQRIHGAAPHGIGARVSVGAPDFPRSRAEPTRFLAHPCSRSQPVLPSLPSPLPNST